MNPTCDVTLPQRGGRVGPPLARRLAVAALAVGASLGLTEAAHAQSFQGSPDLSFINGVYEDGAGTRLVLRLQGDDTVSGSYQTAWGDGQSFTAPFTGGSAISVLVGAIPSRADRLDPTDDVFMVLPICVGPLLSPGLRETTQCDGLLVAAPTDGLQGGPLQTLNVRRLHVEEVGRGYQFSTRSDLVLKRVGDVRGYKEMAGACRGDGWNTGGWPKGQGYVAPDRCMALCEATSGCTAYDLARPKGEKYDCYLFGHRAVVGAPNEATCHAK